MMYLFGGFSGRKLRSFVFNVVIILGMVFGSVGTAYAQDGGTTSSTEPVEVTPVVTETPVEQQILQSIEEPTLEPTQVPPTEVIVEPTLPANDITAQDLVANDSMANATLIGSLPYTSTAQDISGATLETSEPVNVCNSADTKSIWYKFTAPATGVYKVDIAGSTFSPNITILREVDASTRTSVVCGDTYYNWNSEQSSLAFNTTSGSTYFIGFSSASSGTLQFTLELMGCSSGLCGAAVGGDGKVIHSPNGFVIPATVGDQTESQWNGFFQAFISGTGSQNYKVIVMGVGNIIINDNVPIPGVFSPSAFGYPKTEITVKGVAGNILENPVGVTVFSSLDPNISTYTQANSNEQPLILYAPVGTYNFSASGYTDHLVLYKTGIQIDSSGTIMLDASSTELEKSTFYFDTNNNISLADVTFYFEENPPYNYFYNRADAKDSTVTFAAPHGTEIEAMRYIYVVDTSEGRWGVEGSITGNNVIIENDASFAYSLGKDYMVATSVVGAPFHLGSTNGKITSEITDGFGNVVDWGYLPGSILLPTYQITDGAGNIIPTSEVEYFKDEVEFVIPADAIPGIWTVTETIDFGPLGTASDSTTFEVLSNDPPANDDMAAAPSITLGTTYTADTSGATLETNEPVNVCNTSDTNSIWYKFKAPSTGIYKFEFLEDTYPSSDNPDLTVIRQVSSTSQTPVVCKMTNLNWSSNKALSFYATSGYTYLIGISDKTGATSTFKLTKQSCPVGYLCVASVAGDGQALQNPEVMATFSTGGSRRSWSDGSGLAKIDVTDKPAGKVTLYTFGLGYYNYIITPNVSSPGVAQTSAVGLPLTQIIVKDASGNITNGQVSFQDKNATFGGFIGFTGSNESNPQEFYMPAGTYDFFVGASDVNTFIFQPDVVVSGNSDIILDASTLPQDTLKIQLDGLSAVDLFGFTENYLNTSWGPDWVHDEDVVTLAAPENTTLTFKYRFNITQDNFYYQYTFNSKDPITIVGNQQTELPIGGSLILNSSIENAPLRRDEGIGTINNSMLDAFGNPFGYGSYYGNLSTSALEYTPMNNELWAEENTRVLADGSMIYDTKPAVQEVQDAEWVNADILPVYDLKDSLGNSVPTELEWESFSNPATFDLTSTSPTGTWTLNESVDTGPYQGVITGSQTFEVYAPADHPLTNDLVAGSTLLTLPAAFTQDTMGATTTTSDPNLSSCLTWYHSSTDKALASVWYKYVAPRDGMLYLDTLGSTYDTVVAVYTGAPSSSTRTKCNDDTSISDPWKLTSALNMVVKAGTTYFIEVADTGKGPDKINNGGAEALTAASTDEMEMQQIGGTLNLNASLTPCYSITTAVSPSSSGTASIAPVTNCGTKYMEGTQIYLTSKPKTGYNFWKWSTDDESSITTFAAAADTKVTANFVATPGVPALSSPASKALVYHDTVLLKWVATTPVSDHYIIEIAKDKLFTVDLVSSTITGLTFSPVGLLPNTTYYWRVQGVNAVGTAGAWTSARAFRTAVLPPVLAGVYDDSSDDTGDDALHTNRPVFSWGEVPGATAYTIQIARDAKFTQLITTATQTSSVYSSVKLPSLVPIYWRVQASAVNGPSRWSLGTSFTVPAAPALPGLTSPANKALTYDLTPILNWSDVTGAVRYDGQISTDPNFSVTTFAGSITDPLISEFELPSPLESNQTYYWRVRVFDANGNQSGWTSGRILRTPIDPPVLSSPDVAATPDSLRPTFTWEPVDGASGYTVQIAKNITVLSLVGTYQTSASVTSYTPTSNLTANARLWWRVQTKAANGPSNWTDWREVNMPNPPSTPKLVAPAANKLIHLVDNPVLDWANSTLPTGTTFDHYQLVISTSSKCEEGSWVVNDASITDLTASSYTLGSEILPNSTYYWMVRSFNDLAQYSVWSTCTAFRTAVLPPQLSEPADTASADLTKVNRVTFKWTAPEYGGATGYTIQVASNNTFTTLLVNASVSSTTLAYTPVVNLPANKILYWRVQTKAVNGPSKWSNVWTFTVPSAVSGPTLVAPVNSALTGPTPTLTWKTITPPTGAESSGYNLVYAKDKAFMVEPSSNDVLGTSFTTPELEPNTTYYWHVRLYYVKGGITYYGNWSASQTVRVIALSPALVSPESGSNPINLRPRLDWEDVTGATAYTLQIARNATFTTLVGTYSTTAASSEYTPVVDLPANVTLYWRVRTVAANGPSVWSSMYTITNPNPPSVPALVSPAHRATVTTRTPKLDWSNSTLSLSEVWDHYQVQVSTTSTFDAIVVDQNVAGLITNSQYILENDLLENQNYYWRVRSFNDLGEYSSWSSVRWFKVNTVNDTLRISATSEPDSLDPQISTYVSGQSHLSLIYEGLTRNDEGLNIVPAAAQSWEYNEGATEIIFTLRSNLKYSDGSILNAKRFEYSLLRAIDPRTESEFGSLLDVVDGAAAFRAADPEAITTEELDALRANVKIQALDQWDEPCTNYTQSNCLKLKITFSQPTVYFHALMSMSVAYPAKEELILINGNNWWQNQANLTGNGPFKITSYNPEEKSSFIPNIYYWGGIPTYKIDFQYLDSGEASLTAYQNGEVDIIPLTTDQVPVVKTDPDMAEQLEEYPGACTYLVPFNLTKEPFTDPKVREAFSYALDRQAFVDEALNGVGNPTLTWIPEGYPAYDDTETSWAYNETLAQEALAASTYGSASALPTITVTYSPTIRSTARWNWIKDQLYEVLGVEIVLDPDESFEINGSDPSQNPQMGFIGWCADYSDPYNWLTAYWGEDTYMSNRWGFENSAFQAKLDEAEAATDEVDRVALYQEAQTLLIDAAPAIFMYNTQNEYLVKPWVKGYNLTPMDYNWPGSINPFSVYLQ